MPSSDLRLQCRFGLKYQYIFAVISQLSATLQWINLYLESRCRGHIRTSTAPRDGDAPARGRAGGGREKRQREGSSRRAKTKKPREDPEGGSPSAFGSICMDWELNCGCPFGHHVRVHCESPTRGMARRAPPGPGNLAGPGSGPLWLGTKSALGRPEPGA